MPGERDVSPITDARPPADRKHLQAAALKNAENALDEVGILLQRFDDRLTFSNLAFCKRYIDGKLNILLEASCGAVNFNIIFQREDGPKGTGDSSPSDDRLPAGEATEGNSTLRATKKAWQGKLGHSLQRGRCYRNDACVFVLSVKPIELPERGTPSLVWFKPKDEPLGLGADALYFGYATGFKVFSPISDWKSATTVRLVSICPDEVSHQMVQSGAEIVNGVSQDAAQLSWDAFLDLEAENVLSRLRVVVADDLIRVFGMKGLNSGFQIHNVAFGPFNF